MPFDWTNAAVVALLLLAAVLIDRADRKDLLSTALHRLRIRCGKQAPAGRHLIADGFSCRVGRPDTTLVLRLPLPSPGDGALIAYVAVTDDSTRFTVRDAVVTVDEFLEAYDDRLGALEVDVREPGKLATVGIGPTGAPGRTGAPV